MSCDIYANLYKHLLTFTLCKIWTKLRSVFFIHPNCNHGRPDVVGEDADVLLQVAVTLIEFSNPVTYTLAFMLLFFPLHSCFQLTELLTKAVKEGAGKNTKWLHKWTALFRYQRKRKEGNMKWGEKEGGRVYGGQTHVLERNERLCCEEGTNEKKNRNGAEDTT